MEGADSQYNNYDGFSQPYQNMGPPAKRPRGDERGLADFLDRKNLKLCPNHILLITIRDSRYPINAEVIKKVCSIVGQVTKIVVFEKNAVMQAMVEFDTLENASKARDQLHGCDIYNDCCTMRVDYSKLETLTCRENGPMSWDFTGGRDGDKRRVILNEPGVGGGRDMGAQGAPNFMDAPRNMDMMGGNMGRGNRGMGGHNNMGMGDQGNMGMRGQGGPDMRGPQGMGGYDMMGGGDPGFGGSCVVIVHNLADGEVNCDRLFNLACLFGNVSKIFFMKNKPGCAMVEMGDPEAAMRLVHNIQGVEMFNDSLKVEISRKHATITNSPLEWELSDGTTSSKSYSGSRLNRFTNPDSARKNRIMSPSKVLHFYGIPKVSDEELRDMFTQYSAPQPNNIKWMESKKESQASGVGLVYFDSVKDATEALVLVNHRELDDRAIRLCFSPAKY